MLNEKSTRSFKHIGVEDKLKALRIGGAVSHWAGFHVTWWHEPTQPLMDGADETVDLLYGAVESPYRATV